MPNRIVKESIAKSEKISNLTDFQFRLWIHLITYVDDYGRGDARPAIIKGVCFPFRERMTNKDIEKGLADLAGAGCVSLYTVDGKPYLYFPNWEQHQRVRTKVSKCPAPPENDACQQSAADCGELPQNAARIQNPESRIQNPEYRIQESNAPGESADRKPTRRTYGQYQNVLLSDEDYEKLQQEFPLDFSARIERLSEYIASTGKKYKNHLATIRSWARSDSGVDRGIPKGASGQLGQAEMDAIRRMVGN